MIFIITAPDPSIEEYEGIVFKEGVAEVVNLEHPLHAHLTGIGYSVAPKIS